MRPAADHAARGSRPPGRRRARVRESHRWPGPGGSVIRHAAPRTVRTLAVAVVETAFEALLMARPGGADRPPPAGDPAGRRAVSMAPVTRCADSEGLAALAAGSLAERMVHDVGARGARSDWTTSRSRGTKRPTVSVCRSSGRSRGSGGPDRTLTYRPGPLRQLHGLLPSRHAHLPVPGEGSPGQSPNTEQYFAGSRVFPGRVFYSAGDPA